MQSSTEFVSPAVTECDPEKFTLNFFEHQFVLSWHIEEPTMMCSFIVNISNCSMSQTAPFPCIRNVTDVENDNASLIVKNCIEQNKHYPNGVKIFIKKMGCMGENECSSKVYIPIPEKGNSLNHICKNSFIFRNIFYFYRNYY